MTNEFVGMKRIAVDVDPAPEDEEPEGDELAELEALLAECENQARRWRSLRDGTRPHKGASGPEKELAAIAAKLADAIAIVTRMRGAKP